MGLYNKGQMSRSAILEETRKLLNEKGLGIGMELIANELGLSRGRITHFFPTKDSMLVAIMRDYEHCMGELLSQFDWNEGSIFEQHFRVLDIIMDLQYEYRCVFTFITAVSKNQPEIQEHIEASYLNRVDGIHMRIRMMVEANLLEPSILDKHHLNVFLFQYTTLLTSWVVSQEIYLRKTAYIKMKPVYVTGAMQLFQPFLTKKGRKVYEAAADAFRKKTARSARKH
jgi:AcrR family transcriptional regulator